MAKHVHYDNTTGEFLGFYSEKTYKIIPTPTLVITDEQYGDCLTNQHLRKVDIDTQTIVSVSPTVDIVVEKINAKKVIDNTAETARGRYLTPGAGQAITYQEKADEAADYVAAGYPADLTGYPFVQAEVNATGKTATQAADDILTQKSAWLVVGSQIEEARLSGKINIDASNDETAIATARDNAITTLDAI